MKIEMQLFAAARQLAGVERASVELPPGATVAQLRTALGEQYPALRGLLPQLKFAVDLKYAGDDQPLTPTSQVACIPPVSGG